MLIRNWKSGEKVARRKDLSLVVISLSDVVTTITEAVVEYLNI